MTTQEVEKRIAEEVMNFKPMFKGEYPSYATNIKDAFHVIKKMRENGYQYTLESFNAGKRKARCLFIHQEAMDFAYGETEAEAICKAALAVTKQYNNKA